MFSLSPSSGDSADVLAQDKNWSEAFNQVAGEDAVLTGKGTKDQLERKGYIPVVAPENLVSAAGVYGVQTPASVLSVDEMVGRQISHPTPDAKAAVDFVWSWLEETGLTNGKEKPPVKVFSSILDGGTMLNGFYRDGTVFLHEALGGTASEFGGRQVAVGPAAPCGAGGGCPPRHRGHGQQPGFPELPDRPGREVLPFGSSGWRR